MAADAPLIINMDDHFEEDPQQYKTTGVAARMGDLVGLQQMVWNGKAQGIHESVLLLSFFMCGCFIICDIDTIENNNWILRTSSSISLWLLI